MNKIYVIYNELSEPRYVGKTSHVLSKRLSEHLASARRGEKNHRANWLRSMIQNGLSPSIGLLEECGENWIEREVFWIAEGRRLGWKLTNGNGGGYGGGTFSVEVRAKISASKKGRKRSPETIAKMSATNRGRPWSLERRKKPSHRWSAEQRIKFSKSRIGHVVSEVVRAKMRERRHAAKTIAKMSATKKGKKFSEAHKQALREAWKQRRVK